MDGVVWLPMNNWMSPSRNSVKTVAVPPCQYSPGSRRNNNVIHERSTIACWQSDPPCMVALRV